MKVITLISTNLLQFMVYTVHLQQLLEAVLDNSMHHPRLPYPLGW